MQNVVATSVEDGRAVGGRRGRRLCSVAHRAGSPVRVCIRRGRGQTTRPGDALAVVYDPEGRVTPCGVGAGARMARLLRDLGRFVWIS